MPNPRHTAHVPLGAGSGASSSGRATEASELEELLRGFPLVRAATKARVREVYHALRQQHEEKLEEWQRESAAAADGASLLQQKAGG